MHLFSRWACGAVNPVSVGESSANKLPECKFTYVDKRGTVITHARFEAAHNFSEGLAPVRMGKLWGFIDKKGTIVISPRFEDAEPCHSDDD
jgi:hypothetical protein